MPGSRGKKLSDERHAEITSLLRRGKKHTEVAKLTDVHVNTVSRIANDPVMAKDLKLVREDIKRSQLVRGARLQEKAWDLVEAQTGSKGDPRGFKDAMQGIQALEQVTAGASGETQRVEVSGMPPATNIDVKVLIQQLLAIPRAAQES